MKILIACEESQAVTIAFRRHGLEAYSCDLKDCTGGHPEWHIRGDVIPVMNSGEWTAMIAHPPCTHLASSGAKHFAEKIADGRQQQGIEFFMKFTQTNIPHVAIENPKGIMSTHYRKPDQIIQPWMFGDEAQKGTCLWLEGLPLLKHYAEDDLFHQKTHVGHGEFHITKGGNKLPLWYNLPPSEDRGAIRSKTLPGIAEAMAVQWGEYLLKHHNSESI